MIAENVGKALASSAAYQRLRAEMEMEVAQDLGAALKPLVDAMLENAARLSSLAIVQADSDVATVLKEHSAIMAALVQAVSVAPAPAVDLAPLAASIERIGPVVAAAIDAGNRQVLQALASLEAAVMADVKLVTGSGGRPTGTTKVRK